MSLPTFWAFVRRSSSNIKGEMAISKFDLLFDLVTWLFDFWPTKSHRVLYCGRLHMWTKFCDDWSKTATCIAENVTISFEHEYRSHTLTSRCDAISDVIIMEITLVDDLHTIFLYLLSNWGYIENCEILKNVKNWRKFEVRANFFIISVTGS